MKKLIISVIMGIMIIVVGVIAQGIIRFPENFEITLPQLPPRQSSNQIIFNCAYDSNVQYRFNGITGLVWNGNIPQVTADIGYWTNDKNCAGSIALNLTLPITLSQQQLVNNYQTQVTSAFILEAQSNHQRESSQNRYISGSPGLGSSTSPGTGGPQ